MELPAVLMRLLDRPAVIAIRKVLDVYGRAPGTLLANGLAFTALFSIVPIALVTLGVAGLLVKDAAIQQQLATALGSIVPLYDYDCAACGRRFEVIHGLNDPSPEQCPLCGSGPVRKAFAPPAIHFKGSGWAKKERRAAAKSSASASNDADGGSDKGSDKGGDSDASSKSSEKASTPSGDSAATSGSSSSPGSTSSASSD